jgi:hypothetical protein
MEREDPKNRCEDVGRCLPNGTNPLLIGLFRVFARRIVFSLAAPVTPEVAGSSSSPVATPVYEAAAQAAFSELGRPTGNAP